MRIGVLAAGAASLVVLGLAACTEPAQEQVVVDDVAAEAGEGASDLPDPLVARADYSNENLWLCKPSLEADACDVPLDATIIPANVAMTEEAFVAAEDPAIDCFFVYPTVSLDPGYLSDWEPDHMELDDVALQFARFGSVCRTYAPLYRQFTLTALRAASTGIAPEGERPTGIGGLQHVSDAFNWYLENENNGRGFVLVGHSQGSGVLRQLIANEIDGQPVQDQMVSAMLLGTAVMVPEGADVGGSFQNVPLCRAEDQTGCVISYASFRDTNPPPPESLFGRAADGQIAACTNPADLAGGGPAVTDAYFWTRGFLNGSGGDDQPEWMEEPVQDINTPFVKVPGLVSAECVNNGDISYLAMHVNADPSDPRTDELAGEVQRATGPDLAWGLHLIDVDLAMGDLLRIVRRQTEAFSK